MTSQETVKPYTLDEFQDELVDITPVSIRKEFALLKELLQKNEKHDVKPKATSLKREIEQAGNKVLTAEGKTFLEYIIKNGCVSQPGKMETKPKTTAVHVEKPTVDNRAQVHKSVAKDQEKADEMSQPSKSQPVGMSKTITTIQTGGQPSDPGSQSNMSKTLPPSSSAMVQEMVAASGAKDKSEEFIRLINAYLESENPIAPDPKQHLGQHLGLDCVIKSIVKIKSEKKSLSEAIEKKDEKIKSLEDERKEQIKTTQDMEKNYNDHFHKLSEENMKLKSSKEYIEASLNQTKAEKHQIQSYANEMQSTASKLDQKLKKSREEVEGLKQQLVQQAEDNARQKQKLSEEMHRLHSDNKQLKSRISELAGAKLMDNNPDIADLSDPNRAMKLGEKFSSLYDDEWTDHFQIFTEKFKMKDDEAIEQLLQILSKTYDFCRKIGDGQMDSLCNLFEHPCQDISQAMKPQADKLQMTQKHHKELKDLRKKIALKQVDSISKQYLAKENEEAKKGDKKLKQILDETKPYYEKCVEVCWPMVLHDPPLRLEMKAQPGAKIDLNRFRLYGGNGDTLEYLVWPPLQVEGGGLIAKGVVKPKKVPRTPKK